MEPQGLGLKNDITKIRGDKVPGKGLVKVDALL